MSLAEALRAEAARLGFARVRIACPEPLPVVRTHPQTFSLEGDPAKIWESNIFGKSLHELVNEGLHNKLYRMPMDARLKLQETLERIINEGCGGLICFIL